MTLFNECMQWSARKALDTADIVRDGDIPPVDDCLPNGGTDNFRLADHSDRIARLPHTAKI